MAKSAKKRQEEDIASAWADVEQDHRHGGRGGSADSDVTAEEEADQRERDNPGGEGARPVGGSGAGVQTPVRSRVSSAEGQLEGAREGSGSGNGAGRGQRPGFGAG